MIKIFLKHVIYDICIDTFFSNVVKNFIPPSLSNLYPGKKLLNLDEKIPSLTSARFLFHNVAAEDSCYKIKSVRYFYVKINFVDGFGVRFSYKGIMLTATDNHNIFPDCNNERHHGHIYLKNITNTMELSPGVEKLHDSDFKDTDFRECNV